MEPIDILREDFAQTVEFISKCDNHIFQIKNWAIITSSAVLTFSVSQGHNKFALANLPLLIAFLYLELVYKSFQDTAIVHTEDISKRIDKYLEESGGELLSGYQHSYGRKLKYPSFARLFSILKNPNRRHILYFYGFLAFISICAFLVAKYAA